MVRTYDFVAIGDTVVDAFIHLKEAHVYCDINRELCQICMRFADKIPYEEVYVIPAVGNSANAAVAAARLGLKSALVSNLGDDDNGAACLNVFKKEKVGTGFIKINKGVKTNYHYVLWYADDRTILIKHEKYSYDLPEIGNTKWIYFSSLGSHAIGFYRLIESYLKHHPEVKLAFQPGTYQIQLGLEKLAYFYKRSNIFFCNKDEAERILGMRKADLKSLLSGVRALGPEIIVITDGPKGAYASQGAKFWYMREYPDPKPPYERTGAGDAFSSTVTGALALGLPLSEALRWGPVNSMSVVQYVGAREGLLTKEKIEWHLRRAPRDYKPRLI